MLVDLTYVPPLPIFSEKGITMVHAAERTRKSEREELAGVWRASAPLKRPPCPGSLRRPLRFRDPSPVPQNMGQHATSPRRAVLWAGTDIQVDTKPRQQLRPGAGREADAPRAWLCLGWLLAHSLWAPIAHRNHGEDTARVATPIAAEERTSLRDGRPLPTSPSRGATLPLPPPRPVVHGGEARKNLTAGMQIP